MEKYRFKLNSGNGAIVCNNCNMIVKAPAKPEDLETYKYVTCSHCNK